MENQKKAKRSSGELRVKLLKKIQREQEINMVVRRQQEGDRILNEVFANMEELKQTFRRIYGPHNYMRPYNPATRQFEDRQISNENHSNVNQNHSNNGSNSRKRKRDSNEENESPQQIHHSKKSKKRLDFRA